MYPSCHIDAFAHPDIKDARGRVCCYDLHYCYVST